MPFVAQAYAQQRPDLAANWQKFQSGQVAPDDPLYGFFAQFPSFEAFLQDDYNNNPANQQQTQAPAAVTNPVATAPAVDVNALVTGSDAGAAQGAQTVQNVVGGGANVPAGGNFANTSTGVQTGGYGSSGTSAQTSTGQRATDTTTAGGSTQTSTNTGMSTQDLVALSKLLTANNSTTTNQGSTQNTGSQASTGTSTGARNVTAPFDIAGLVGGQLPMIGATDMARSGFLTDFMINGGSGLNSQIDQGVRQSLSGPGMTGVGESAAARAAGYAASDIARNNAGQRIQAAGMLGQPTGAVSAANALAPLYGETSGVSTSNQTQSSGGTTSLGTGTTAGTTTQTGSNQSSQTGTNANTGTAAGTNWGQQAMTGFDINRLVGSENTAGTAFGNSGSTSSGTAPTGQPVKTGGCVVCTAYASFGLMHPGAIRRAVKWKLSRASDYALAVDGYMLYGPTLARWVLKRGVFAKLFRPIARAILYHEVYLSAPTRLKRRLIPLVTHELFDLVSRPVGLLSRLMRRGRGVQCPIVRRLLVDQNLNFPL